MSFLNIEIKARCNHPQVIRDYLLRNNADFRGIDHQSDTYFHVNHGRLKLREGNIENNLIFYNRPDEAGPKASFFQLVKVEDARGLKEVLTKANGVKICVRKKREIYYIGNVKFHIDDVEGLGAFVEIEAGNKLADLQEPQLREQCNYYLTEFSIQPPDLINLSYSDMLMQQ